MLSEAKEQQVSESLSETVAGRGMLVVVSSPSGGGKGTLIRRALKTVPNLGYSVSFTTRPAREGEIDGRDYFFVPVAEFKQKVEAGDFLEWAVVHGNLYGTSYAQVQRELIEGHDIILEIDVQGAASVRKLVDDAVSIFILPPTFEILRARLEARGSERPDDLALRLRNSRGEVEHYREFQYVIINDDADRAAAQLASIIYAERARCERQQQAAQRVLASFKKKL
ncbi:MAG: guanylate kinase [Acidobacteriota bacterium]|jgi:guanylate kinase|nr:guanylate kinase [Acidobacteriota bacterium]